MAAPHDDTVAVAMHEPIGTNHRVTSSQRRADEVVLDIVDGSGAVSTLVYMPDKVLGKGSFAKVVEGRHKQGDRTDAVAVKLMDLSRFQTNKGLAQLNRELSIQARLVHPNLVLHHMSLEWMSADRLPRLALVLERCDGTLDDMLGVGPNRGALDSTRFLHVARDCVAGMSHLRRQNVVHRDIKAGNVLFCRRHDLQRDVFVLADYGLARVLGPEDDASTICGTARYVAPEIYKAKHLRYGFSADVWSLGVMLYRCATNTHLFPTRDTKAVMELQDSPAFWEQFQQPGWLSRVEGSNLQLDPSMSYRVEQLLHGMLMRDAAARTQISGSRVLENMLLGADDNGNTVRAFRHGADEEASVPADGGHVGPPGDHTASPADGTTTVFSSATHLESGSAMDADGGTAVSTGGGPATPTTPAAPAAPVDGDLNGTVALEDAVAVLCLPRIHVVDVGTVTSLYVIPSAGSGELTFAMLKADVLAILGRAASTAVLMHPNALGMAPDTVVPASVWSGSPCFVQDVAEVDDVVLDLKERWQREQLLGESTGDADAFVVVNSGWPELELLIRATHCVRSYLLQRADELLHLEAVVRTSMAVLNELLIAVQGQRDALVGSSPVHESSQSEGLDGFRMVMRDVAAAEALEEFHGIEADCKKAFVKMSTVIDEYHGFRPGIDKVVENASSWKAYILYDAFSDTAKGSEFSVQEAVSEATTLLSQIKLVMPVYPMLEDLYTFLSGARQVGSDATDKLKTHSHRLVEVMTARHQGVTKVLHRLDEERSLLETRHESNVDRLDQAVARAEAAEAREPELAATLASTQTRLEVLSQGKRETEDELTAVKRDCDTATATIDDLKAQLAKAEEGKTALEEEYRAVSARQQEDLQQHVDKYTQYRDTVEKELTRLRRHAAECQEATDEARATLEVERERFRTQSDQYQARADTMKAQLQNELTRVSEAMVSIRGEFQNVCTEHERTKDDLDHATATIANLKEMVTAVQAENASLQEACRAASADTEADRRQQRAHDEEKAAWQRERDQYEARLEGVRQEADGTVRLLRTQLEAANEEARQQADMLTTAHTEIVQLSDRVRDLERGITRGADEIAMLEAALQEASASGVATVVDHINHGTVDVGHAALLQRVDGHWTVVNCPDARLADDVGDQLELDEGRFHLVRVIYKDHDGALMVAPMH